MSELHNINVSLSEGQKRKLLKAYKDNEQSTTRLKNKDLTGSDVLMVPMNTVKKTLEKTLKAVKGMEITISKSNIRKEEGKGIFSSLMPLLKTVAPTIGKTLGLSALAGATSEGASQIIKKITGGQVFQVPHKDLNMLAQMGHLLRKGQINDLANAQQGGEDMLFKITQKQVGNGIGSILARIGILIILDTLMPKRGRGAVRMGRSLGAAPRIGAPPPFIGTWKDPITGRG